MLTCMLTSMFAELLMASSPTEGKFFVRGRGAENPGEYVLTVMYKGKGRWLCHRGRACVMR